MTLWNPKKPRQLVADDCETDLNLSDAMQMVVVGAIFWCDRCQGYHAVATPQAHYRPEGATLQ